MKEEEEERMNKVVHYQSQVYTYCMQTKCMHTRCRVNANFACIRIANLAHTHLLVVRPKRPAVDKLLAKEVLVPYVKAAEDLYLKPIDTMPAAIGTHTLLYTSNQ